jgi:hypothetical protein
VDDATLVSMCESIGDLCSVADDLLVGEAIRRNDRAQRPSCNVLHGNERVDPLVGGRIEGALSSKTVVTLAGDVGGWGTSQIDYQIVGLLGYKLKPGWTLQGGYPLISAFFLAIIFFLILPPLGGGAGGPIGVFILITRNSGDRAKLCEHSFPESSGVRLLRVEHA